MVLRHAKAVAPLILLLLIILTAALLPSADGDAVRETDAGTVADGDPVPDAGTIADGDPDPDAQSVQEADPDPDADAVEEAETETEVKSVLTPDSVSVVSEEAEHCAVFGSRFTRNQIASVTVLPDLSAAPESAWDVSAVGDGSVLAWTLKTQPPFDLYIAGDGALYAPPDCSELFCGYVNLTRVVFDAPFDTSAAVDMSGMFDSCVRLTELDVSGFDTSAVTDMQSMFRHCAALETLDVAAFRTSAVTDMRSMFRGCTALERLDISAFDLSAVTDLRWMFADCTSLRTLLLPDFDFSSVPLRDGYLKNAPMKFAARPLGGTEGYEGRNYDALFDGDPDTKWCLPFENVAYVEWKMATPGSVAHLYLTSGDNHDAYPGRNPGSWRLLGTDAQNRKDGVWTVLGGMDPAGFENHDSQNYLIHTTYFNGEPPAFEYYRFEVTSTTGAQILQLSELAIDYR